MYTYIEVEIHWFDLSLRNKVILVILMINAVLVIPSMWFPHWLCIQPLSVLSKIEKKCAVDPFFPQNIVTGDLLSTCILRISLQSWLNVQIFAKKKKCCSNSIRQMKPTCSKCKSYALIIIKLQYNMLLIFLKLWGRSIKVNLFP